MFACDECFQVKLSRCPRPENRIAAELAEPAFDPCRSLALVRPENDAGNADARCFDLEVITADEMLSSQDLVYARTLGSRDWWTSGEAFLWRSAATRGERM